MSQKREQAKMFKPGLGLFLFVLSGILAVLFWRAFDPAYVVFANDGPLGAMMADRSQLPEIFTGGWVDLNAYGYRDPGAQPNITSGILLVLGPLAFSKFYPQLTLLILGTCAWFFFRQLGLGNLAATLGGLAAALSPDFFSTSCWGVGPQAICFGLNYFALGIVFSPRPLPAWLRYPLAGFAVGMGVMEAYDIGAIFSVATAICVVVRALICSESKIGVLTKGIVPVAVIALCAALLAAAALWNLVTTQISGVAGMSQEERTNEEQWRWATELGSMPKLETLGILVPGLFGYRMDTPNGGAYWGKAGRSPEWDAYLESGGEGPPPMGRIRFGGAGPYAGVLVLMISFWAIGQSFRGQQSVFTLQQRRFIWFLTGAMFVCLLLSFGRYAPFYKIFFSLPFASTIRIPGKFFHVLQWFLLMVFAFGLYALKRRYMNAAAESLRDLRDNFDRKWILGCGILLGVSILAWMVYARSADSLVAYLEKVQFDPTTAKEIAAFSVRRLGWFVVLLGVALALFRFVLKGYFSGKRSLVGAILLGTFLTLDLAQVGVYWIVTYNWKERYLAGTDNELFRFLRDEPHLKRVTIVPRWFTVWLTRAMSVPPQIASAQSLLDSVYTGEWMQHQFQFYNIQSLDVVQMPRPPQDLMEFETALFFDHLPTHKLARKWELTNTRYIFGAAALGEALAVLDPNRNRFRPVMAFELYPGRPGEQFPILVRTNSTGPFALYEFTGALPRARLYAHWQVQTNDEAALKLISSEEFNPTETVVVAQPVSAPILEATNSTPGVVKFVSYAPKRIVLEATSNTRSILLLNDKHDPNWKVKVDGRPAELLRCNFIMRGVLLESGSHQVEFSFEPPFKMLYVSLVGICLSLILACLTIARFRRKDSPCSDLVFR